MKKKLLSVLLLFFLILFSSCTGSDKKTVVKEEEKSTEAGWYDITEKPKLPDGFFEFAKTADGCYLDNGDMCFIVNGFKDEKLLKTYYDGTESCALVFFDGNFNLKNCIIPKDLCENKNSVVFNGEYIYLCTNHTLSKYNLKGKKEDFIPLSSDKTNEIFISDNSVLLKTNEEKTFYDFNLKEINR